MAINGDKLGDSQRSSVYTLIVCAIVIAIFVIIYLLFHFVYQNTTNVFYGMLGNSLSTSSFTKQITQQSSGTITTQTIYLETGAHNITLSKETQTVPDGSVHGKIETLNVGTPSTDYSKFVVVDTGARNSSDYPINYSTIIGVWSKNMPGKPGTNNGQLFTNALLGSVIPIGNVTPSQKDSLIKYIRQHQVYIFGRIKKASVNGRSQFTYEVGINLPTFASMLNQFGNDLGMKLSPPNVNALKHQVETVNITVDALSRQLVSVSYLDTPTKEVFSSLGVKIPVNLPKSTISLTTLESEIKKIGSN